MSPAEYNAAALKRGDITPAMFWALVLIAQRHLGVAVDGMCGPRTRAALLDHLAGPPTEKPMSLRFRALEVGVSLIGQGEETANNEGPTLDLWRQQTGLLAGKFWCAVYISKCWSQACQNEKRELPFRLSAGALALGLNMLAAGGVKLEVPEPGSIGVWKRPGGHHVAFFYFVRDDDSVTRLQGNHGQFPSLVGPEDMTKEQWQRDLVMIVRPPG